MSGMDKLTRRTAKYLERMIERMDDSTEDISRYEISSFLFEQFGRKKKGINRRLRDAALSMTAKAAS